MEQWIIKLVSPSQLELVNYLETSPLMMAVKKHRRFRKTKIMHRQIFDTACVSQLGNSFLLDVTNISSLSSPMLHSDQSLDFQSVSQSLKNVQPSGKSEGLLFNLFQSADMHTCLKRNFTPVFISPSESVQLCVMSLKVAPQNPPTCPLCLEVDLKCTETIEFKTTPLSKINIDSHVYKKLSNPTKSQMFADDSAVTKSSISSPVVVMTHAHESFFQSALHHSFKSVPLDWTESDQSTLTKKSSKSNTPVAPSSSPPPPPLLESPPRKQQRIASISNDFSSVGCHLNQQDPSLSKVIAEFTLLNMKRELALNKSKSDDRPVVVQLNSDCETSVLISNSKKVDSPIRLSRRRNAASASAHENTPFFNRRTGLPLQSSPVPLKRSTSGRFDFDSSLCRLKTSKSSTCMLYNHENPNPNNSTTILTKSAECSNLVSPLATANHELNVSGPTAASQAPRAETTFKASSLKRRPASLRFYSNLHADSFVRPAASNLIGRLRRNSLSDQSECSYSAPPTANRGLTWVDNSSNRLGLTPAPHASSQHLLVNFEESMLNGRIHPVGQVEGFSLELGASGSFYPNHVRLSMKAYFFDLSDDDAPSPYLGYANLRQLPNNKGYHVPKKGSIQLTLFNPTGLVVKMFVIAYDLEDMPANSQTFLRQRTVYMPTIHPTSSGDKHASKTHSTSKPDEVDNDDLQDSNVVGPIYLPSPNVFHSVTDDDDDDDDDGDVDDDDDGGGGGDDDDDESSLMSHAKLFWDKSRTEPTTPSGLSQASCSCSLTSSNSSMCSLCFHHQSGRTTELPAYLRYLVHLRFHTTRSGKLYLHTDLRLIFSRDKFEFDPRVATYELRSFVDAPTNPRYSPKKWSSRSRTTTITAAVVKPQQRKSKQTYKDKA